MSCPTCTDSQYCMSDNRCDTPIKLDNCNWSRFASDIPYFYPPYYVTNAYKRPIQPFLRNFYGVEGFGNVDQTGTLIFIILLVLVLFYIFH